MRLDKLFSLNPSKEEKERQNKEIAIDITDKLSNLLEEFDCQHEEGVPIINESLSKLASKDSELAHEILSLLKTRHSEIDKKFPFKIN